MKYLSIILICLFTFLNHSFASQYGSISGYVLDESFEGLPGADIKILNTNYNGEADDNGYYKIIGIKAGIYTLQLMFVGYAPFKVYNVKIVPESDTEIVVCLGSDVMSDFYGEYDGSDSRITPYNPSKKNIDLEKTGKVEIKEKSKCPKLNFTEKFNIIKKGLNNLLPAFQKEKCVGRYLTGEDGFIEIFDENSQLHIRISDIKVYEWYSQQNIPKFRLFHLGNNKFIIDRFNGHLEINNGTVTFFMNDKYFRIVNEKSFKIFDQNTIIPILLLNEGKVDVAIDQYKIIYKNNPKNKYTSPLRLSYLYEYFISRKDYQAALSIAKLSNEFYPDLEVTYKRLAEVFILLKDYESALEAYKEGLKHDKYDHFKFNDLIKELERKLK